MYKTLFFIISILSFLLINNKEYFINNKKKVAICLRGSMGKIKAGFLKENPYVNLPYINYNACHNSIIKHIVNFNKNYDFDFFIHSWNPDLEKNMKKIYKPKASIFEKQTKYQNLINKNIIKNYGYTAHQLGISKSLNVLKKYVNNTNKKYNLVIIYRPDVMLMKDIDLNLYNEKNIYVNDSVNEDFHFIMNFNNSMRFSNIFGKKMTFKEYINKILHSKLTPDNIKCGIHQEVMRKLYSNSIKKHNIKENFFYKYGITKKEIKLLTHS